MGATVTLDIVDVRRRFSALQDGFVFFDAPGGSQVPDSVGDAMARCLREASANLGARYATSHRVAEILETAEIGAADLLGCDAHEVIFGLNMTSLNFALSRTAARDFKPGDEILVSSLDHDAGIAPWLDLAADKGLVVRTVALCDDTTLDYDDLRSKLTNRTRVVAFAWASNAIGTITDAARVCALAHDAGALAWIDAVHYAAHRPIDVREVDADVLICSTYKFCGPHLGLAYGRAEVLDKWHPYKVRPAPNNPLGRRFATGTLPYEMLAGFNAALQYLEEIGGFDAIVPYERTLSERFVRGLPAGVHIYGLPGSDGRVPTFLATVDGVTADAAAQHLAERQIGVWASDTWYSLALRPYLAYPDDALRIGLIHYNTADEVDQLHEELARLAGG